MWNGQFRKDTWGRQTWAGEIAGHGLDGRGIDDRWWRPDVILLRSLGWASPCRLAGGKEKCLLQQWTGGNGLWFSPTLVLDY